MSGIVGYFNPQGLRCQGQVLKTMAQTLVHRGADHQQIIHSPWCALAIQEQILTSDTRPKQPIQDEATGRILIFDGFINNIQQLQAQLRAQGYACSSDGQTLLAAHHYWGPSWLTYVQGMFALCLWIPGQQTLILARDQWGQKPLFYSQLPDQTLVFASEIKALLSYPGLERSLNIQAMGQLLDYGFNLAPSTFLKNVHQVMPAHSLEYNAQGLKTQAYWQLKPQVRNISIEDAAQGLQHHLIQATKKCLGPDDLPRAAYLSGGIDSSAIAGIYARQNADPIHTLSIIFAEADYNEQEYARLVAQTFGTKHQEFMCTIEEDEVQNLIWFLETPLVTLLNLPLYLLSRQIQAMGFNIVLSGDGADEILGGYDYFKLLKLMPFVGRQETPRRTNLLRRIWPQLANQDQTWMRYQMLKAYPMVHPALPYRWQAFQLKNQLLSPSILEYLELLAQENKYELPSLPPGLSLFDQALFFETQMRLPNLTLALADRMSMANGVQLRSPFVDHQLMEYAFSLPSHFKMQGLNEKYLLKRSLANFLPQEIVARRKQPLAPPGKWFVKKFRTMIGDVLAYKNVRHKGYFQPEFTELMLQQWDAQSAMDYSGVLIVAFFIHLFDDLFLSS